MRNDLLITISYDRYIAIWRTTNRTELTELSRSELPALIRARVADFLDETRIVLGTFGSRYATFDGRSGHWNLSNIEVSRSLNAMAVSGSDIYSTGDAGAIFKNGQPQTEIGSLCNFLLTAGERMFAGGQQGELYDPKKLIPSTNWF